MPWRAALPARARKLLTPGRCDTPYSASVDELFGSGEIDAVYIAAKVKLMTAYRLHFERANLEAAEVWANATRSSDERGREAGQSVAMSGF